MPQDLTKLCFGNIRKTSVQSRAGFVALALTPTHDQEIEHDICKPLPVADSSVDAIQAEDVLEHVPLSVVPKIFDDIFRVLKAGGHFRLSVPDYRSPVLRERSVYDSHGSVVADLRMGGSVRFDGVSAVHTAFKPGGDAHLWFPTYETVMETIIYSTLRKCEKIRWRHYWRNSREWVVSDFESGDMPVMRAPPRDMRADGMPISIIVDFVK
ncbi:MAG: methyltransferase domain-containing protein [Cyanobacteria bacterium J06638_22]